jgi:multiple sugar transport system ATP-binding protein
MTLANKIVLLRAGASVQSEGSVAQVGSPMALYHRPQNLFVAEFIGSPKMNILPGRMVHAEPDHAVVDLHGAQIKVACDARDAAANGKVFVGIRPEHLAYCDMQGDSSVLRTHLRQVERLGDESFLYLELGADGPLVTLRVEGSVPHSLGGTVGLRIPAEHCHLFDSKGDAYQRTVPLPS